MSKIDDKYIDALQLFTEALEKVVETLREQQKSGKSDVVNEMLKNMPSANLEKVVNELKIITEKGFKDTKSDNQKILKSIESIKKQKESGMFDKIEDPKNKNKIVDGIKVVMLIAAGVLAVGMAFKIIGKVDFLSVIALSTAMLLMAVTYQKLVDQKGLTFKKVLLTASILPIMAAGLVISGLILKTFPKFTLAQGLSIIIIGGALGLATMLLLKSLEHIKIRSLFLIPLIPIIMPLIALGIVKASKILTGVQQISLMQAFAIALVGLALGLGSIGIAFALRVMKGVSWKEMLMLPIMIPLLAGSIVIASKIFQDFQPIKSPFQLLLGSLAIGLSILLFSPSVYILGKLSTKQILKGALAIPIVSTAIVIAANIMQELPSRMKYPTFMWSLGTGLALLAFAPVVYVLGKLSKNELIKGTLAALALSGIILATALIFTMLPNRMIYPDFMWSLGVGLSLVVFGVTTYFLGKLPEKELIQGIFGTLAVAGIILGVALIFKLLPSRMEYPDFMWTLGVGLSLGIFGLLSVGIGFLAVNPITASFFWSGLLAVLAVAGSMVIVSKILSEGDWTSGYPSLDWALGVGGSLLAFSIATVAASAAGIVGLIGSIFTGGVNPIVKMAETMVEVSNILKDGDWGSYPTKEWSLGVGTALVMFASAYATISMIQGFNSILSMVTGTKKQSFNQFVLSAVDTMLIARSKLNVGDWKSAKYPTFEWSLGVGTALVMFAGAYATISMIQGFNSFLSRLTKSKKESFGEFVRSAVDTMLVARNKLNVGDWKSAKHPSKEWSEGIGTSLYMFAKAYAIITALQGFNKLIEWLTSSKAETFSEFVKSASISMGIARDNLRGDWSIKSFPSKDWAEGVGTSLVKFAEAYAAVHSVQGFADKVLSFLTGNKPETFNTFVENAIDTMIIARDKLKNSGTWNTAGTFPSKEYAEGVGGILVSMAQAYKEFNSMGFFETIAFIFGKNRVPLDKFVIEASNSIVNANNILGNKKYGTLPDEKYISGFGIFVLGMADIIDDFEGEIDLVQINQFSLNMKMMIPAIVNTSKLISQIDDKLPSSKFVNKFGDFIFGVSEIIDDYDGDIIKTNKFITYLRLINAVLKMLPSEVNVPDRKLTKNLSEFVFGISEVINESSIDNTKIINFNKDLVSMIATLIIISEKTQNLKEIPDISSYDKFITNLSKIINNYSINNTKIEKFNKDIISIIAILINISEKSQNLKGFPDISSYDKFITNLSKIVNSAEIGKIINFNKELVSMIENMIPIAMKIILVDKILSEGKYSKYPPDEWIDSISLSLLKFASFSNLNETSDKLKIITNIANNIITIDKILNEGKYSKYPPDEWIKSVSLSLLKFSSFLTFKESLNAIASSLVMLSIAGSIIAVDKILSQGKYSKYPSDEWMKGVSSTILNFGFLLNSITSFILGASVGSLVMLSIAASIIAVDKILSQGKYSKYPPDEWIKNVSSSILKFGSISVLSAPFIVWIVAGSLAMSGIAGSIIAVDKILSQGKYSKYPQDEWIKGVGLALISYAGLLVLSAPLLGLVILGSISFITIASSMLVIDKILNLGSFTKYPSEEWASGVMKSMMIFSTMGGDKSLLNSLTGIIKGAFGAATSLTLIPIAMAIVAVDKILSQGKFENYPSIGWINSITTSLRIYATTTILLAPVIAAAILANVLMLNLAISMISIAKILNSVDWNAMKIPSDIYMSNYQNFLLKIYETYNLIDSSDISRLIGFTFFSINSSTGLMITSLILNKGKYDMFPSKEYIDNFSYFIITISNIIKKSNFNEDDSLVFLQSTILITPAIENWIRVLSKGNYSNYPSFEYTNNFAYFTYMIGTIVRFWLPTVEKSVNFNLSSRFIVNAIKNLSEIPTFDNSFGNSVNVLKSAIKDISIAIDNWNTSLIDSRNFSNSLRFIVDGFKNLITIPEKTDSFLNSLKYISEGLLIISNSIDKFTNYFNTKDLSDLKISMKYIVDSIKEFSNIPNINDNFVTNIKNISNSLMELSKGIDEFMYEKRFLVFRSKKSMLDFINFSVGLKNVADGIKTLSEIKSIPDNVVNSLGNFLDKLNKMPNNLFVVKNKIDSIKTLADSLLSLADSLNKVNTNLDGFLNLSKGLFLISIIDDVKLGNVLGSIEKHRNSLQVINKVPEEQVEMSNLVTSLYDKILMMNKPKVEEAVKPEGIVNTKEEVFYSDISEIKNMMAHLLEHLDRPSTSGSFQV